MSTSTINNTSDSLPNSKEFWESRDENQDIRQSDPHLEFLSAIQSLRNSALGLELMRLRFRLRNLQFTLEERARIFVITVILVFTAATFIRITYFFCSATNYTAASFHCLEKNTASWKEISADDFAEKLRDEFPRLVNRCSDKQLGARVQYLGTEDDEMLFAFPLVWAAEHSCDVLFIKDDVELVTEQLFKDKYPYCTVYSANPGLQSPRGLKVIQHPIYITNYQRTNKKIQTRKYVDIVTYIQKYIRHYKLDTLVLGNRDNTLRLFSDLASQWGPVGENNIAICQMNIAIKIPESNIEKQIFKDLIMTIIKEKRYLLTKVSFDTNKNILKLFMVYSNSSFCWAKYISSRIDYNERL